MGDSGAALSFRTPGLERNLAAAQPLSRIISARHQTAVFLSEASCALDAALKPELVCREGRLQSTGALPFQPSRASVVSLLKKVAPGPQRGSTLTRAPVTSFSGVPSLSSDYMASGAIKAGSLKQRSINV